MLRTMALIILTLGALTLPVAAQHDRDQDQERIHTKVFGDGLVIPGQRVGPIHLGMSIAQILQVMPPRFQREVFSAQGVVLYEWRAEGFWVSLDAEGKSVRVISVFGLGTYHTDEGVQLMHPESKMTETYGKEFSRYEYPEEQVTLIRYISLGLQFGLVNQPSNPIHGRIFQIGIFTPGKEPPLAKTPSK